MKTIVDARLRDEARRFALRFACEDCANWSGAECANGWPDRVTREAIDTGEVTFCKEFELAESSATSTSTSTLTPTRS